MELEGKRPWSTTVVMEALSERYGWTPDQIQAMAYEDVVSYLTIIAEMNRLEDFRRFKARKH